MFDRLFPAKKGKEEVRKAQDPWEALDEFWRSGPAGLAFARGLTPAVDVSETPTEVIVRAELPGMDPEDIELTLEQGVLSIRGEKKREEEKKDEGFHRVERSYGAFSRSVRLPPACLDATVRAGYKNGVLTVTVPKNEKFCARRIEIEG